jgi:acetolactate synthase I/II/III large subunit
VAPGRTTVADVLVDGLRRAGIARLFAPTESGASAVLAAARARGLAVVAAHSESTACLMAAVTGELTGTPGVAVICPPERRTPVTPVDVPESAPGAPPAPINTMATSMAYARTDCAPLILITEASATAAAIPERAQAAKSGPDRTAPLPIDHATPFGALSKQTLVVEAASASHWIAHAVQLALKDPRGPVHLDLAIDVASTPAIPVATNVVPPGLQPPDPAALASAADLIRQADRPLIIAGLGCRAREDSKWLRAFAEALPAPVLTTPKAKGAIPEPHPLSLGIFSNRAFEASFVRRADLIIGVGLAPAEFEPGPWRPPAPVAHLSRVPHAGEVFQAAVEVIGEPASIFEELAPRLRGKARADWDVFELDRVKREQLARLAVGAAGRAGQPAGAEVSGAPAANPGVAPHRVIEIARELSPAGTVAVTDPGPHAGAAMWFWSTVAPGEFLIPSVSSSRSGFALPAAIAAQLVYPRQRVVCFTGIVGLRRAAAELETAVRLRLPIAVLIFDDGSPGVHHRVLGSEFGVAAHGAVDEESTRRAIYGALTGSPPTVIHATVDQSTLRAQY